ncbi:cryptochrome [Coniochaeta ligniaria NRRL 30616]|uniref:Cryptochrome DASH n=1 Tax=Coniochaeta ligniaria NRRL 30616 TaxID=1408157 RepID=A0A1J7JTD3_9PEZI|nr:cryptochrome [Coniochaeta ligniaria NRRL 30616]
MATTNILIYLMRKDLRVADNPIFHYLSSTPDHGFTHLLPVYVFPYIQMDLSGLVNGEDLDQDDDISTRSRVGHFARCGPHRAKFIAETVWNLKSSLEALGSGLILRAGDHGKVVSSLVEGFKKQQLQVGAVWTTGLVGSEEVDQEGAVSAICGDQDVDFKIWPDEKYFVDDRDLNFGTPEELPTIFTTYLRSVEPLREKPRSVLPTPVKSSLPVFPEISTIAPQASPFAIPDEYEELEDALVRPVEGFLGNMPAVPEGASSAHPFKGGEDFARDRLDYVMRAEVAKNYKDTRNGLIGADFSTKLSAYLALGTLTARQIHEALLGYEDGSVEMYQDAAGFGEGENDGTKAVRNELLWRDYMRLYHKKFGNKLFQAHGLKADLPEYQEGGDKRITWKTRDESTAAPDQTPDCAAIGTIIERFNTGTTGMGLIDASQRELMHSGYTSNRARQNVANFLAKHLGIDWRYGAEWYEMLLIDYDVSSNWANWQYVAGVGNDPRSESRLFNPVKQAFDYDKEGSYVRTWVPEVSKLQKLENVFQACTASEEDIKDAGLEGNPMVTDPVKKIDFSVEGKPRTNKRSYVRRKGRGKQAGGDTDDKGEGQTGGGDAAAGQRDLNQGWRSQPSPTNSTKGSGSTDIRKLEGPLVVASHPNPAPPAAPGMNNDNTHRGQSNRGGRGGRGGFFRGNNNRGYAPAGQSNRGYRPSTSRPTEHHGMSSRATQTPTQPPVTSAS